MVDIIYRFGGDVIYFSEDNLACIFNEDQLTPQEYLLLQDSQTTDFSCRIAFHTGRFVCA